MENLNKEELKTIEAQLHPEVYGGKAAMTKKIKSEGIDISKISKEFNITPDHRKNKNAILDKIKEVSEKHKIKTSTGREIEKKEKDPNSEDWVNKLEEIISNPESINNVSDYFNNIVSNSSEEFRKIWEKQKENMDEMDDIIREESDILESFLKEGSVINGLFVVKNYMEKLIVLLNAVEGFLDMEISSSPNYEEIRSPYGRTYMNINNSIMEIETLIENVINEKKRLKNSE